MQRKIGSNPSVLTNPLVLTQPFLEILITKFWHGACIGKRLFLKTFFLDHSNKKINEKSFSKKFTAWFWDHLGPFSPANQIVTIFPVNGVPLLFRVDCHLKELRNFVLGIIRLWSVFCLVRVYVSLHFLPIFC